MPPDLLSRLEPATAAALAATAPFDLADLPGMRRALLERPTRRPDREHVVITDLTVPADEAGLEVRLRSYRPRDAHPDDATPSLVWLHGGGFIMGSIDRDDGFLETMAHRHGCTAVSIEWRQSPEDPFPAAHQDAYRGVTFVFEHAAQLGIDPARIVLGGGSCGGGLAAGVALRLRDEGRALPCLQLLIYPMLDDRPGYRSAERITDDRTWSAAGNAAAWRAYLGESAGSEDVSEYAAPARATDLAGLPPAFIAVGVVDVLRDEDVDFARRLMIAEVPTELHVYPSMTHGFNAGAVDTPRTRQFIRDRDDAMRIAFDVADESGE